MKAASKVAKFSGAVDPKTDTPITAAAPAPPPPHRHSRRHCLGRAAAALSPRAPGPQNQRARVRAHVWSLWLGIGGRVVAPPLNRTGPCLFKPLRPQTGLRARGTDADEEEEDDEDVDDGDDGEGEGRDDLAEGVEAAEEADDAEGAEDADEAGGLVGHDDGEEGHDDDEGVQPRPAAPPARAPPDRHPYIRCRAAKGVRAQEGGCMRKRGWDGRLQHQRGSQGNGSTEIPTHTAFWFGLRSTSHWREKE